MQKTDHILWPSGPSDETPFQPSFGARMRMREDLVSHQEEQLAKKKKRQLLKLQEEEPLELHQQEEEPQHAAAAI
jgi:hypothetical protein